MVRWVDQPLSVKLPLALLAVFLVALVSVSAVLYRHARGTVVTMASDRLLDATQRLAEGLGAAARLQLSELDDLAGRTASWMATGSADASPPVDLRDAFARYLSRRSPNLSIEIWDVSGRRRYAVGAAFDPVDPQRRETILEELASEASRVRVSPLRTYGGPVVYHVGAPLRTDDRRLVGFLLQRRQLDDTPRTTRVLSGLVGYDAAFLVGNRDGTQWTDLGQSVSGMPEIEPSEATLLDYVRPGRGRVLARAAPVPATPWMVVVEFPRARILAPAQQQLVRSMSAVVLVGMLATGIGWVFVRRVAAPLRQLETAARAVAHEQAVPRIEARGTGDVGRLTAAFNTMVRRVEESQAQYQTLVRDLEARVEARTEALQAANRELEAFSYSVSHDLRTPLRAIAGFADVLSQSARPTLTPDESHALDRIQDATRQMDTLISDLLALARIGHRPIAATPVDMTALASEIAERVGAASSGRQAAVEVASLPAARGDRSMLRQVFENLIENAAKFTQPGTDARVSVGATQDGGRTVYFVRDNGVGFDMKYKDKLFGVFQRLHSSQDFEGTGVGLAIVHRVIERHGGQVWAQAAVGQGATFYFTVPGPE